MAKNKQGCGKCKFLRAATEEQWKGKEMQQTQSARIFISPPEASGGRTLSSAPLSPVVTWQVLDMYPGNAHPTHLYRSGYRRGTALDPAMATATELRSIQLSGNALAQSYPGRT